MVDTTAGCTAGHLNSQICQWLPWSLHCPSYCYISRTHQQHWPMVSLQHWQCIANHGHILPWHAPRASYSGHKYKLCRNINMASCLTWHQTTAVVDHRCCKPSTTVVSPSVWSTVVNRVQHSDLLFTIIIIIIIIIIRRRRRTDLYSAFRSEDTEALGAAQED